MPPLQTWTVQLFLGHVDGAVEGGLDGGGGDLAGGNVGGPGEDHAREGLGDEEAVPGAKLPGAVGLVVKAADPGAGGLAGGGLAEGWQPTELASRAAPGLATKTGPRGPSAVMAQQWPSA